MLNVSAAAKLIDENLPKWGEEEVKIVDCFGRKLKENILADREYPPFDRVMMDGICVKIEALEKGVKEFRVSGVAPAGSPAKSLASADECIEVMTGAMLPTNSDVVIPYEEVEIIEGIARIDSSQSYRKYQNVHRQGSDTQMGDVLLRAGQTLLAPQVGVCASVGKSTALVERRPRINIISTGDELVEIDQTPEQYQIRKSNSYALRSLLQSFGHQDAQLSHLNDDPQEISDHFSTALNEYDVLIYSGGVSKGKFDYLPHFWEESGVEKIFHRVSQRPGKPLWFGVHRNSKTVIWGLPGNPVSSLVCLRRYFLSNSEIVVRLGENISFKKDLTFFAPVRTTFESDGTLNAWPVSIKNSGEFSALSESDGFIELPQGRDEFIKGECFSFYSWGAK